MMHCCTNVYQKNNTVVDKTLGRLASTPPDYSYVFECLYIPSILEGITNKKNNSVNMVKPKKMKTEEPGPSLEKNTDDCASTFNFSNCTVTVNYK